VGLAVELGDELDENLDLDVEVLVGVVAVPIGSTSS
jgi:hypothetical protein